MTWVSSEESTTQLYRVFLPHVKEDLQNPCLLFWYKKHPIHEFGDGVTFTKHKISMLQNAVTDAELRDNGCKRTDPESQDDFNLGHLPNHVLVYNVFSFLCAEDIVSFSRTCKAARVICYENLVWKRLCYRTFENPALLNIDISNSAYMVHFFRSKTNDKEFLKEYYADNCWRLVFMVLFQLEKIPSVVYPVARNFSRCTSECLNNSRSFNVTSSQGTLEFTGVQQATCVEYVVYNYEIKAGHRKNYREIKPWDTNSTLKQLGLNLIKTRRKFGPVRRCGYFLYTDLGHRVDVNYKWLPSLRFRVYKMGNLYLLLCHDLVYRGGKYSDVFRLFRVALLPRAHSI